MADNPADSIVNKDKMRLVADESAVGDKFEGESERERKVGVDREVVVDIFKRKFGFLEDNGAVVKRGSYFLRVSLRSMIDPRIISRFEIDLDKHSTEGEFLKTVMVGGGAIAEADNENRGANWDCDYVAKQAYEAAKELLHDIDKQD